MDVSLNTIFSIHKYSYKCYFFKTWMILYVYILVDFWVTSFPLIIKKSNSKHNIQVSQRLEASDCCPWNEQWYSCVAEKFYLKILWRLMLISIMAVPDFLPFSEPSVYSVHSCLGCVEALILCSHICQFFRLFAVLMKF